MTQAEKASLDKPSETRTFDKGMAELVTIQGNTVGRFSFEPGWRWSESVKPLVKTDTCQSHHLGVVVSGKLRVEIAGSDPVEIEAGDAYDIPPGHDAAVVGDEMFIGYEFLSAGGYAKPAES
jgi:mannose-6-phosphate isomerase-like protein (cupin superfamily)